MCGSKATTIQQLRKVGIKAAAGALFYSGALNLLRGSVYRRSENARPLRSSFVILLYHRVNPHNDPFFPAISVKTFEGQIKYIKGHFEILPLTDIIFRVRHGLGLPKNTVAVTFDDGYRDNFIYAHPILKRYNCPATLFTATNYIGTERWMWNDELAFAIRSTTKPSIAIPGVQRAMSLSSVSSKLAALDLILGVVKGLPEIDKGPFLEELKRHIGEARERSNPLMLSWGELKEMVDAGWEVGSHTASHVILSRVSFNQATEEIRLSRSDLERQLGRPVDLFAYPNGKREDYNAAIKEYLREAGYLGAVTTVDRMNREDVDLFEMGRKSPWEECGPKFALRINQSFW